MGYQELISALRREVEEKIEELWREARSEAERARGETAGQVDWMRREFLARRSAAAREVSRGLLGDAEREARRIRLATLRDLSARLTSLGGDLLRRVREERPDQLFEALARELPRHPWETVWVNPADARTAAGLFPEAEIIPDPAVSGGLRVGGEGGRITIDNTLEKRLARGWLELLPRMIAVVRREAGHDDAARNG